MNNLDKDENNTPLPEGLIALDLNICLIASILRNLDKSRYDRNISQVCAAFHDCWRIVPEGLDIKFVHLAQGWHSNTVQSSLFILAQGGFIELFDRASRSCILGINRGKIDMLYAAALENFRVIEMNIFWIEGMGRSIGRCLDMMEDASA